MSYKIKIAPQVIKEDFKKLTQKQKGVFCTVIEDRIAERPYDFKPLRGKRYRNIWRLRVGDYRIVYRIEEDDNVVYILCLDVRGKVYEKLEDRLN
jgi:mRNA interferase RelE/StbE